MYLVPSFEATSREFSRVARLVLRARARVEKLRQTQPGTTALEFYGKRVLEYFVGRLERGRRRFDRV